MGDTFTVQDEWSASELGKNNKLGVVILHPDRRVVIGESAFSITDKIVEKSQMNIVEVGDTFTIKGELDSRSNDTYVIVEHVPLADEQEVRVSITVEGIQPIELHDIIYDPVVVGSLGVESLEIFDSPFMVTPKQSEVLVDDFEGSEVGQVYDFSHLDKGFG